MDYFIIKIVLLIHNTIYICIVFMLLPTWVENKEHGLAINCLPTRIRINSYQCK